jgi:kinetochore protein Mis13/DSN1
VAQPEALSISPSSIDPSTLGNPSQTQILESLLSTSSQPTDISTRLQEITSSLEPTIDLFADGVHRIAQYRLQAERVGDKILGDTAARLERREREVKEAAATTAVDGKALLGALSQIYNEQQR